MRPIPSLDSLGPDELIGQTLCFGWQGCSPDDARTLNGHARELIDEMHVGGVVMLARNFGTPEAARALIEEMQERSSIPLLINVDQEGGTVNRIRPPFHEFPGNMALGAITRGPDGRPPEAYTRLQADAVARELGSVGVNWNTAPVVDVNNNPDNPIIGVRSYGGDPVRVAQLGAEAVRGYQSHGVMACAKHFPGHGDTAVDSHLALPVVNGDRERMDSVELVPFQAAINAGVGSIMTTHILFSALDTERPATVSAAVLTSLLREEMGFQGVIVTDCLEMKAIANTVGTPRGAVQALKAGADVVLVCHTLETQRAVVAAIRAAVDSGSLPKARLREAAGRVLEAKQRFVTDPPPIESRPWMNPEHDALEEEIARASITFARSGGALPLRLAPGEQVLLVSGDQCAPRLADEMRRRHGPVGLIELSRSVSDKEIRRAAAAAQDAAAVVVATAPEERRNPSGQAVQTALVNRLLDVRPTTIAVAIREPYDIRQYPRVQNYVCSYGDRPCSLRALADALFGVYEPTGRIP